MAVAELLPLNLARGTVPQATVTASVPKFEGWVLLYIPFIYALHLAILTVRMLFGSSVSGSVPYGTSWYIPSRDGDKLFNCIHWESKEGVVDAGFEKGVGVVTRKLSS